MLFRLLLYVPACLLQYSHGSHGAIDGQTLSHHHLRGEFMYVYVLFFSAIKIPHFFIITIKTTSLQKQYTADKNHDGTWNMEHNSVKPHESIRETYLQ
jgi:hypothetical protein